jgi:hypothetical protein
MSMGPITIFDKSALQGLNIDEACWFDNFYMTNIAPLFFVETLGDLRKEMAKGRTAEEVVGNLAEKTPPQGTPNVHHRELCIAELMGQRIEMRGVPHVGDGRPVVTRHQRGLMYEPAAEMRAFQRWQEGRFLDVEYQFAGNWRLALQRRTSLDAAEWLREIGGFQTRPHDLKTAKAFADRAVRGSRHRYALVKAACLTLEVTRFVQREILMRWKAEGGPPFHEFAPYTAHVLTVDAFFYIAVSAHLISRDRPSNRVDMAYLYYLPFCMVFVSCDNLHEKTVPLFLGCDQCCAPIKIWTGIIGQEGSWKQL